MYRVFSIIATSSSVFILFLIGGAAIAGPQLICEEPTYDFGEREGGESVEHAFVIKNVGDAPAEMKELKPSCGGSIAVS